MRRMVTYVLYCMYPVIIRMQHSVCTFVWEKIV